MIDEEDIIKSFYEFGLPTPNEILIDDGLIIEYSGPRFKDLDLLLCSAYFRRGKVSLRKNSNNITGEFETTYKHQTLNYLVFVSSQIDKFGISTLLHFNGDVENFIKINYIS